MQASRRKRAHTGPLGRQAAAAIGHLPFEGRGGSSAAVKQGIAGEQAAALDLICSGGYEADSEALIGDLKQALDGLSEPLLNLAPLQALVGRPTDWTTNVLLKEKAREVVAAAAAQQRGFVWRSIAEIQRDIEDTNSMLRVGGLAEHRRARLQSEADGFIAELYAHQESEQQAAALISGQDLRIQEVKEMLKAEIEMHEEAVKMAAGLRGFMGTGRRFLQARETRAGGCSSDRLL